MCAYVPEHVDMRHVYSGAYGGQKRASDPLQLELKVIVSCHNQTQIFCKNKDRFNGKT